ncbi:MAG: phosphatidate cytidylyltransferase [Planctomycetota bacterium]
MPLSRKVAIRVVGAPLLLGALAAILYADYRAGFPSVLRWLLMGVAAVSSWEFYGLCAARGIPAARAVGTLAVAALFAPWPRPPAAWGTIALGYLLYVLLKLVFRHGRFGPEAAALSLAGFAYVGLLAGLLTPPVAGEAATFYLLFLLAANKGADMAAYVVGKAAGRRPLAPVLSPRKTWEGFAGGALGGTAAALGVLWGTPLQKAFGAAPAAALLLVAVSVTMAAQVGDLVESAFKRWAGLKDSGRLLPEFGGMLDMVDSFLVSIPVAHAATLCVLKL